MSFGPFLGGKRICIGKTFAEYFAKIVTSIITYNYEFKFVDESNMNEKPFISLAAQDPVVMVTVAKITN
jgi:cytochrome P450